VGVAMLGMFSIPQACGYRTMVKSLACVTYNDPFNQFSHLYFVAPKKFRDLFGDPQKAR
jgi:hypothetical protein